MVRIPFYNRERIASFASCFETSLMGGVRLTDATAGQGTQIPRLFEFLKFSDERADKDKYWLVLVSVKKEPGKVKLVEHLSGPIFTGSGFSCWSPCVVWRRPSSFSHQNWMQPRCAPTTQKLFARSRAG